MFYKSLTRRSILAAPPQHHSRGWRRRSALALLAIVLMGGAAYRHFTKEARLIMVTRDFLQGMTGGEVSIGHMDFSFFGGIDLTNVIIRTPRQFDFGPTEASGRIVCDVAAIHLEHSPLALLLGQFRVRQVTAVRPYFQIVYQKSTGLTNWQAMLSNRPPPRSGGKQQLPAISLRRCSVRTGSIDGRRVSFAEPVELDVLATPVPPGRYICTLQPLGLDRLVRTLDVDLDHSRIRGDLPGIWIPQIMPALPAEYAKWCDILELTGQVNPQSIEFDSNESRKCTISLSQMGLSVPVDESEFYGDEVRARRLVRLKNVSGRIAFEPATITFDIAGHLNDAPCHVWGHIDGYTGPADKMGYEVHMDVQRLAVPNRQDPYVADQIEKLPWEIRRYFKQFDPMGGWVGVTGCVSRQAGADQSTKFRGVVTTDDVAGYYDDLPYHGQHAKSTIRCTDDGIFFTVLAGRDPFTFLRIDGWVADGRRWCDVDVRVQGVNVPLSVEMFEALPPKFQQILNHFDLYGLINCDFRLIRRGGIPEVRPGNWQWETTIVLRDVAGRYKPFNYMQHGLCGTLTASNGIINKIDLYAVDPHSSLAVRGWADLRDDQGAVDLHVRTNNRPLTPDVLEALPQAAQQAIGQAGISGLFDIDAWIQSSKQTDGELQCRVDARWKDGRFAAAGAPYPFRDVRGHVYVDMPANRIDIDNVTGRAGPASMRLDGTIHTGSTIAAHFDAGVADLPLTQDLYDALPAEAQHWWQVFQPSGAITAHSAVDVTTTSDGQPSVSHKTTLVLQDNRICWESFPLPIEQLCGTVLLTGNHCRLQDIRGTHAGAQVRGSGQIDWSDDSTRADVKLVVRDMPLDEPLREAVPWQLRRIWNDWQPAGKINADIDSLRYRAARSGGGTWDLDGSVSASLSKLLMAVEMTDAEVEVAGAAHIDEQKNEFSGCGTLRSEKAVVSLIPVTNASGQWVKKASGSAHLNEFRADALGGSVVGSFEVEPTLQGDRYGAVLTLNKGDPGQLARVLTDGQMNGLTGTIETELRLRGLSGHPETRSGSLNLRLEGQGLYRLPGLLQLANVLNIPVAAEVPERDTQQITARLTLAADKALFDSLELHDRSFIMQGTGLVDLPTHQADLTVVAARPSAWPKVPVLTEMLEGTVRELVEVHGTGPINDLKFEAKPLRSLQAALQLLSARHPATRPAKISRPKEEEWQSSR